MHSLVDMHALLCSHPTQSLCTIGSTNAELYFPAVNPSLENEVNLIEIKGELARALGSLEYRLPRVTSGPYRLGRGRVCLARSSETLTV